MTHWVSSQYSCFFRSLLFFTVLVSGDFSYTNKIKNIVFDTIFGIGYFVSVYPIKMYRPKNKISIYCIKNIDTSIYWYLFNNPKCNFFGLWLVYVTGLCLILVLPMDPTCIPFPFYIPNKCSCILYKMLVHSFNSFVGSYCMVN